MSAFGVNSESARTDQDTFFDASFIHGTTLRLRGELAYSFLFDARSAGLWHLARDIVERCCHRFRYDTSIDLIWHNREVLGSKPGRFKFGA